MKPVVFGLDASAELGAAVAWYDTNAVGLGEGFLLRVEDVLQLIAETPTGFPTWDAAPRIRGAVVQRFPYVVSYRELADRVEVVAVAHGARSLGYWLKRE